MNVHIYGPRCLHMKCSNWHKAIILGSMEDYLLFKQEHETKRKHSLLAAYCLQYTITVT
jgi:hypothetical protein